MTAAVQTYPPLGQVTTVESGVIDLKAVLVVSGLSDINSPWHVSLWCSVDGKGWGQTQLHPLESHQEPQCLQPTSESITRFFTKTLAFNTSIKFTIMYRHDSEEDWRWVHDEHGLSDGIIVPRVTDSPSEDLTDLVESLDPEWAVNSCLSQSPKTSLWSLEAEVPRPKLNPDENNGDGSTFKDIRIGSLRGSFIRWFALIRNSSAWLAPRQGKDRFSLDKDAVLCAFLRPCGRCVAFLGLGGINNVLSVLRSTPEGQISVHARNDGDGQYEEKSTVLVAESADLDHAVAATVYHARDLAYRSRNTIMGYLQDEVPLNIKTNTRPEWLENWYDGLGFCTWNALGQQLTENKIIGAVDALAESNVDISSLIIDDNWQSLDTDCDDQFHHGWLDFEADPKSFPHGLKATVSKIRKRHPNIQHIIVWHALLGYWGGIAPSGKLANTYKTVELSRQDTELPLKGTMTVVDNDDVPQFYNDFYKFLLDAGIDGTKTDVQFMVDTWTSARARRNLFFTYLDTWRLAALRHFNMKSISCMSLFPQGLFFSQLDPMLPEYIVRSSDDFFPNVPTSHAWHIWANAHNCILLKNLNVLPDWDMFQTTHDYAGFHAAARCVSGGPIYITDVPGEHNVALIHQVTGKTPRGTTVVFRPSVIGRSTHPFVGYDDNTLLKVGSYHGASETGTPILALFNVSDHPLTEIIPLSTFPGTVSSCEYIVRAHTTGIISTPTTRGSPMSLFTSSLGVRGYEILCAFPLRHLPSTTHERFVSIANMGLLGKMTGCAAIMSNTVLKQDNGRMLVDTSLKALGVLGLYISCLPDLAIDMDCMITIQGQPIPFHTVKVSDKSQKVLEVDVEKAWKEMGLDSGWGNEVKVKVNFNA